MTNFEYWRDNFAEMADHNGNGWVDLETGLPFDPGWDYMNMRKLQKVVGSVVPDGPHFSSADEALADLEDWRYLEEKAKYPDIPDWRNYVASRCEPTPDWKDGLSEAQLEEADKESYWAWPQEVRQAYENSIKALNDRIKNKGEHIYHHPKVDVYRFEEEYYFFSSFWNHGWFNKAVAPEGEKWDSLEEALKEYFDELKYADLK